MYETTRRQAETAFNCLRHANDKPEPDRVAYLLHAAVLFFLRRDQRAFLHVYHSPLYEKLNLHGKLRQLPLYQQTLALVKSSLDDYPETARQLAQLSDESLGVETFKRFRDYTLINGLPGDGQPFANPPQFDAATLTQEALTGWDRLQELYTT